MTPTLLKALARLHPVIITLWGSDDNDPLRSTQDAASTGSGYDNEPELLTRELRRVMTVACEIDDMEAGRWRRRLWVRR